MVAELRPALAYEQFVERSSPGRPHERQRPRQPAALGDRETARGRILPASHPNRAAASPAPRTGLARPTAPRPARLTKSSGAAKTALTLRVALVVAGTTPIADGKRARASRWVGRLSLSRASIRWTPRETPAQGESVSEPVSKKRAGVVHDPSARQRLLYDHPWPFHQRRQSANESISKKHAGVVIDPRARQRLPDGHPWPSVNYDRLGSR
jgi:hypothetical protein